MEAGGRLLCVLVCAAGVAVACASPPAKPQNNPPEKPVEGTTPPPDTTQNASHEFVASAELYRATFREVQDVVAAISRTIAAGDYDGWLAYLTEDYVESRSSNAFLADASDAAVLKKSGIVLRSLKDYFQKVVVQSHLQATLEEIQFLDETHVKAFALVQGTPVILYYLVHEKGKWKVGLRQNGQS